MIEFTLSKINMLILVVALFSIISFFSLNVGKIFLVGEVKQQLDKDALTLNNMMVAPTTCDSKPFVIPPRYTSFGSNVYYTLAISKAADPNGVFNRLIFSVSDVRQPTTVLAASSITTPSRIVILDNSGGAFVPLGDLEELRLDPQSVPPVNAFYAVKSVKQGLTTLYIFPCAVTSTSNTCYDPVDTGSSMKHLVNQYLSQTGESFVC